MSDNNLPPLPQPPIAPKVELGQSGEFTFFSNLESLANIPRNWTVSYERLQSQNPNASTYQLIFSSGVGTAAETVIRGIATYQTASMAIKDFFETVRHTISGNSKPIKNEIYGGSIDSIIDSPTVYSYINKVGTSANNILSDAVQGGFNIFNTNPSSNQNTNTSANQDSISIIQSTSPSGQTTSITATKSTNSSGTSSVSLSSENYSKDELIGSSNSLLKQEGSGSEVTYEGTDGIIHTILLDDSLKSEAEKFILGGSSSDSVKPIISIDGDDNTKLNLVEKDKSVTLSDGTTSTLGIVLDTISSAKSYLVDFVQNHVNKFASDYQDYIIKNKEYIIGDILARVALGESLEKAMVAVAEVWGVNALMSNPLIIYDNKSVY